MQFFDEMPGSVARIWRRLPFFSWWWCWPTRPIITVQTQIFAVLAPSSSSLYHKQEASCRQATSLERSRLSRLHGPRLNQAVKSSVARPRATTKEKSISASRFLPHSLTIPRVLLPVPLVWCLPSLLLAQGRKPT